MLRPYCPTPDWIKPISVFYATVVASSASIRFQEVVRPNIYGVTGQEFLPCFNNWLIISASKVAWESVKLPSVLH